jgi:hypothetical protein
MLACSSIALPVSGDIVNIKGGTISAAGQGIFLQSVTAFSDDITNSGTVQADGIQLHKVVSFDGQIVNGGTIRSAGSSGAIVR